jgi:hypothetical protein
LLDLLKIGIIWVGHRRGVVIPVPSATRTVREVFKHLRNIQVGFLASKYSHAPKLQEGSLIGFAGTIYQRIQVLAAASEPLTFRLSLLCFYEVVPFLWGLWAFAQEPLDDVADIMEGQILPLAEQAKHVTSPLSVVMRRLPLKRQLQFETTIFVAARGLP